MTARKFPDVVRGLTTVRVIMIILGILVLSGLVVGLVVPAKHRSRWKDERALGRLRNIADAVLLYKLDRRVLPTSLADLEQKMLSLDEPYFDRIGPDPWGSPYQYRVLDAPNASFEVSSPGEDLEPGTADDWVERRTNNPTK